MDTIDPNAPADTRLMGIIHDALRRDLRRTQAALTATPPPSTPQREAIGRHLEWMMRFLHAHHRAEDEGLYPMVSERNPAAAVLIERMGADHEDIAPACERVQVAAARYRRSDSDDQRESLLAAVHDLTGSLLPHLRREEDEMMPVVSAAITQGELRRWDEERNIKPKSLAELGREGHWILDGLGPEDRDLVVHLVPPISRLVLLHGFAGAYRRHLVACWGEGPLARRRLQTRGHTEVTVEAGLAAVWDVVRDVTRIGEWSHECVGATWLDGAQAAVPGARFRGRNRNGVFRWGRVCEVIDATPWGLTWRTVPTALFPDSTEWRIRLHEADGGTRIEQTFRALKVPRFLDVVYAAALPAHRDRTRALTEDLRRLGAVAAGTRVPTPSGTAS